MLILYKTGLILSSDGDVARQQYIDQEGSIRQFGTFGVDPLRNRADLVIRRDAVERIVYTNSYGKQTILMKYSEKHKCIDFFLQSK